MKHNFESTPSNPEKDQMILLEAMFLEKHPDYMEADWIEEHGEDLRRTIEDNPALLEHFKENPDDAISELEDIFYH